VNNTRHNVKGRIWFNMWICSVCGYKTEDYIGEKGICGHVMTHVIRRINEEAIKLGAKKNLRPNEEIPWGSVKERLDEP